jgi:hypothetical protein
MAYKLHDHFLSPGYLITKNFLRKSLQNQLLSVSKVDTSDSIFVLLPLPLPFDLPNFDCSLEVKVERGKDEEVGNHCFNECKR